MIINLKFVFYIIYKLFMEYISYSVSKKLIYTPLLKNCTNSINITH